MTGQGTMNQAFMLEEYMFRRKVLKIFGGAFHVYDNNGKVVFYSEQKAFRLKEDFRIYSDESKTTELLMIKTPQILDVGATYYVTDAATGQSVGSLRRRAFKSILKDEWAIFGTQGSDLEIGRATESSIFGALLSRFIKIIPQSYVIETTDNEVVATVTQQFNPFVLKYTMKIGSQQPPIDRRLLIAMGIMLAGIEGRQE